VAVPEEVLAEKEGHQQGGRKGERMKKYVVVFTWEETCYVLADSQKEARWIASSLATNPATLDLCKTEVRAANLVDKAVMLWPDEDGK
jgi:hypothetical protein